MVREVRVELVPVLVEVGRHFDGASALACSSLNASTLTEDVLHFEGVVDVGVASEIGARCPRLPADPVGIDHPLEHERPIPIFDHHVEPGHLADRPLDPAPLCVSAVISASPSESAP